MTPRETEEKIKELEEKITKNEQFTIQLLKLIGAIVSSRSLYGRILQDGDGKLRYEPPSKD